MVDEFQFYWLIGILEGEGSFIKSAPSAPNMPRISLQMSDEDVVRKVASIFNCSYFVVKPRKKHWKTIYQLCIRGKKAVDWMNKIYPHMSHRRQNQICSALNNWQPPKPKKINHSDYELIKERIKNGETHTSIARSYNVDRSYISHVSKTW